MATFLTIVAMLNAAVSFGAAFFFWDYCLKVEKAWTASPRLEKTQFWKLESVRKRWALVSAIGYVAVVLLTAIMKNRLEVSQTINLTLIGVASAGLLITAFRAMCHNGRSVEASLSTTYRT